VLPDAGTFLVERAAAVNGNTGLFDGVSIITRASDLSGYAGKRIEIRYAAADYGQYFTPDPTEIGAARRGNILIYLAPTLVDSNSVKRIDKANEDVFFRMQSVTVGTSLAREELSEIGHYRAYARTITFPVPITVALEAIDADPSILAKLCEKDWTANETTGFVDTELSIDDLSKDLNLL